MALTKHEHERILQRRNDETAHDHYVRVSDLKASCESELNKPRCVNCEHLAHGRCAKHDSDVPDEYILEVNNCEFFDPDGVPF